MPNWCGNRVTVDGSSKAVKEFKDKFLKGGISAFYPTPKELESCRALTGEEMKALDAKYGAHDGYSWRLDNWGTKWDVEPTIEGDVIEFESAWSPPIEAFEKISELNPDLRFAMIYLEPGVGFLGECRFEGGLQWHEGYNWEDRFNPEIIHITRALYGLDNDFEYYTDEIGLDKNIKETLYKVIENGDDELIYEMFEALMSFEKDDVLEFIVNNEDIIGQ